MIRMVNDSTPEWAKTSGSVPIKPNMPSSRSGDWVKVSDGVPGRASTPINQGRNKGFRSGYCTFLLGTTTALTLLGLIALLSGGTKDEETGYRLLKVAKTSSDVAKSVCNC